MAKPAIRDRIVGIQRVKASELLPHPMNPRRHPTAQMSALQASLDAVGYADCLLAYQHEGKLRLFDGHARRDLTPDAEVPVLVTDLTEAEARMMMQLVDPLAAMAETDSEMLASLRALTEGDRLEGLIAPGPGLDALLGRNGGQQGGLLEGADPDAIPEEVKTRCKSGDLWALGEHRLLCGDSTNAVDVDRLAGGEQADAIFTDPPYGIGYRSPRPIAGNEKDDIASDESPEALQSLLRAWLPLAQRTLRGDGTIWTCCGAAGPTVVYPLVLSELARFFNIQDTVAWDKEHWGTGWLLRRQWEAIIFAAKGKPGTWHGGHDQPNIVRYPRMTPQAGEHPTPKPVQLVADFTKWVTEPGDFVWDFFGGSGSTLLACQTIQRRARLIELEPIYCDITLARYEAVTGREAILLEPGSRSNRAA